MKPTERIMMFNNFVEIIKDELYALKTRPQRRKIEKALKDPTSTYSINLEKFVNEQRTNQPSS
jgi:hypothetical protein